MRHFFSFLRCPLGYLLNALVTLLIYAERLPGLHDAMQRVGDWLIPACEAFCLRDGIQDDMLF